MTENSFRNALCVCERERKSAEAEQIRQF